MQRENRLYGEIVLKLGLAPREAVVAALRHAHAESAPLGKVLLQRGLITDQQAAQIASHQRRILSKVKQQRAGAVSTGGQAERVPEAARAVAPQRPPERIRTPLPDARSPQPNAPIGHANAGTPTLHKLLDFAAKHGASDLHVHAGGEINVRIHGELRSLKPGHLLSDADVRAMIREVTTPEQWATLEQRGQVDFAYEVDTLGRFRVNGYRQQRGMDLVCRLIPSRIPSLADLGLPERLAQLMDYRTGLGLCTGPVGCGKSTTLASLLSCLASHRAEHVITLENPIEFVFPSGKALINQRAVGSHTASFARALRGALREDPDVIAITELRDRESISLALSAAETGHLVMGTLHTGNASQTVTRIINSFPANEQGQVRAMLSESLRAVISQRLVPRANGKGRACALELLLCTPAVANLIREDKTTQLPSVMQTGKSLGMLTLDDSLAALVSDRVIDLEQARRFAVDRSRFAG